MANTEETIWSVVKDGTLIKDRFANFFVEANGGDDAVDGSARRAELGIVEAQKLQKN